MHYEIWIKSIAEPPVFQPERLTLPAIESRAEAESHRRHAEAADRVAYIVERDVDGNMVPTSEELLTAGAAHDDEAATARTPAEQLAPIAGTIGAAMVDVQNTPDSPETIAQRHLNWQISLAQNEVVEAWNELNMATNNWIAALDRLRKLKA